MVIAGRKKVKKRGAMLMKESMEDWPCRKRLDVKNHPDIKRKTLMTI
jgi:hypothetical protein